MIVGGVKIDSTSIVSCRHKSDGGSSTLWFAIMTSVDPWQECRHTPLFVLAFPRRSHARTRARTSEGVNGFSR